MSTAEEKSRFPDAMIIIVPMGDEAVIDVTYSHAVSHVAARDGLTRLARLQGWKLSAANVNDQEMFGTSVDGKRISLGKQTGVEATAKGVTNLTSGSAYRLQPLIEAYKNLNRIDILFVNSSPANFTGLRSFDHPALAVTLMQEKGSYRYRVDIRDHSAPLPQLPLNEPPPLASVSQPAAPESNPPRPSPVVPIAIMSACAGLAAFATLRLLALFHKRGRAVPVRGRTSPARSGPYIVSRRKD